MIISRTPYRISFFGGGSDYPGWYRTHGGSVLATTINKYCYLTCRYLPPFFEHRIRLVYSIIENCQRVDEIRHSAARAVLQYLEVDRGVEIHHDGDLPARSGMGSSSAFTVGLLHSLYALRGYMPTKHQLALESITVEQEILRETVGSQDQVLAAYGGFNYITFSPNGEIRVTPVTVQRERVEELNANLMLFYTGIKRTASDIAGSYVTRAEDRTSPLARLNEFVQESLSVLNDGNDLARFGELLHWAWQTKRELSPLVSSDEIDALYAKARAAGAVGGKITGAGGGGFLLLFVPPPAQPLVREALRDLIHVPIRFEYGGSQIILCDREEEYPAEEMARAQSPTRAFVERFEIA
jgi:D-glycero-alpha-D-manno-heptose-7-phosphate kinase